MNKNCIAEKYQEKKNCEQELAEIHESTSDSLRKLQLHCLDKANFTPKTELLIKSLSMKTNIQDIFILQIPLNQLGLSKAQLPHLSGCFSC